MRRLALHIMLVLVCSSSFAQYTSANLYVLFDDYMPGTVFYKNGSTADGVFNFNLVNGKMWFKTEGEEYELADAADIGRIAVGDRAFLYVAGELYEIIPLGNFEFLYVKRSTELSVRDDDGPYGTSTVASAVDRKTSIVSRGATYNLSVERDYEAKPSNSYGLIVNSKFSKFNSARTLSRILKTQKSEIENYVKENDVDFQNVDQVLGLVKYIINM